MTHSIRRWWALPASAALALGALSAITPSASAAIDPSAYGVWATGASASIAPSPAVDWTAGPGLSATSLGEHERALSAGPASVAAGEGYATAIQTDVHYGALEIRAVIAICRAGRTSVRIYATDGPLALTSTGPAVKADGISVRTDVTTRFDDGSVQVAGAVITGPGGEQITVAAARCGAN